MIIMTNDMMSSRVGASAHRSSSLQDVTESAAQILTEAGIPMEHIVRKYVDEGRHKKHMMESNAERMQGYDQTEENVVAKQGQPATLPLMRQRSNTPVHEFFESTLKQMQAVYPPYSSRPYTK